MTGKTAAAASAPRWVTAAPTGAERVVATRCRPRWGASTWTTTTMTSARGARPAPWSVGAGTRSSCASCTGSRTRRCPCSLESRQTYIHCVFMVMVREAECRFGCTSAIPHACSDGRDAEYLQRTRRERRGAGDPLRLATPRCKPTGEGGRRGGRVDGRVLD